jgi:hypothetical protein
MNINVELTEYQEIKLRNVDNISNFIKLAIDKQIELMEAKKYKFNDKGDFKDEIWKDIPSFENYYQASNLGRLRSVDRTIVKIDKKTGKEISFGKKGRILTLNFHHSQYLMANLSKKGEQTSCSVHRLIAMTFIPNNKNHPIVNHKNGIKTDNNINNLEWMNNSENVKHAVDTGLLKNPSGEEHGSCKYTNEDILKMRDLYSNGKTQVEIGKIMNMPRARVWEIVHRKTWKHI